MLEAALHLAKLGWHILPLCWPNADGKCGCGRNHNKKQVGKAPLTKNGWKDATTDPNRILAWWTKWPEANIGVALAQSGICVIDVDSEEALAEARQLGLPAGALCVRTGSGKGYHFYFSADGLPRTVRTRRGESGKIDVMATDYVVAPPSRHVTGGIYEWISL